MSGNIKKLIIKLENIITKCDKYSINYGSFDVVIYPKFTYDKLSSINNIRTNINWLHPGMYEREGNIYSGGVCHGEELYHELRRLVASNMFYNNKQQFNETLSHILHDYFSICQSLHIEHAHVPQDEFHFTNDDFFTCVPSNSQYHISNQSKVKNVSNQIYDKDFFDKRIVDYNIFDCKQCSWCGVISAPTEKCFMCEHPLYGGRYGDYYDTELLN